MNDKVTLHKNEAFIREQVDDRLKDFLSSVFLKFEIELTILANALYPTEPEKVFDGIEATWVGIMNNAIIKEFVDDVSTMQEFSVKVSGNKNGRADYYVRFKQEFDLLFEAKINVESGLGYDVKKMNDWYNQILKRAFQYYENNSSDYAKSTFIVAIVFGMIRNEKSVGRIKKQFNKFIRDPIDSTDFWALYHLDNSGISIYGKIRNVKESANA